MLAKKGRNVKYWLVTRLTTECVINLAFVGLLPGLVFRRRFQPDEVLMSQQFSGFFNCLSAKKQLEFTATDNEAKASEVFEVDMESVDEDEISAEAESHLSAVCAKVMRDVAIQHPIVSFNLNICELVRKRTLTTLFTRRRWVTAKYYILDFSHSSSPLLVKLIIFVLDDFQYIRNWRVQKAQRAQKGWKCSNPYSPDKK